MLVTQELSALVNKRPILYDCGGDFSEFDIPLAELTVKPGPTRPIDDVVRDFERRIQAGYFSPELLRYHNWEGHSVELSASLDVLRQRCEQYGVQINFLALRAGIYGHDAFMTLDERMFGMKCKEQLAGHVSYNSLRFLGASEEFAREVEGIIYATHVRVDPRTPEQKLMRALDIGNIAGSYDECLRNTMRLFDEVRVLSGQDVSFDAFVNGSMSFLPGFFRIMIQLTPQALDSKGRSKWHLQGLDNMVRLFRDSRGAGKEAVRMIAEMPLASSTDSIVVSRGLSEQEFFIGVGPEELLRGALTIAGKLKASGHLHGPIFYVPGSAQAVPIPDGLCHEVHLRTGGSVEAAKEAVRILRSDGVLRIYSPIPKIEQGLLRFGLGLEATEDQRTDRGRIVSFQRPGY